MALSRRRGRTENALFYQKLARRRRRSPRQEFIAVACAGEQPAPGGVDRLAHEYELRDHLDAAWALRPLDLVQEPGRAVLLLEPAPGSLDRLIAGPMEAGDSCASLSPCRLRLAGYTNGD